MMILKEQVEEDLINKLVMVDISKCTTTVLLPWMHSPSKKL